MLCGMYGMGLLEFCVRVFFILCGDMIEFLFVLYGEVFVWVD